MFYIYRNNIKSSKPIKSKKEAIELKNNMNAFSRSNGFKNPNFYIKEIK